MTSEATVTEDVPRSVLVTGAAGYVGKVVTRKLAADPRTLTTIVATDVKPVPARERVDGVVYAEADIRTDRMRQLITEHHVDAVVHLAAIVKPPREGGRELAYSVDVDGTRNLLEACLAGGVKHLVVTSSGAAYGYHPDNSPLLDETDPLRGNRAFAYSHHKMLVEQMLATWRAEHPELEQLVLRPGTVLGRGVSNQITDIFERPVVVGLEDVATPFVFVWDEDVANVIVAGVHGRRSGIYNLAGDGVMTLREIAAALGKPYVALPVKWLRRGLRVLQKLGVGPYGPEQVCFLQYRPVLSNRRLKREFGYRPQKTSREVFDLYRASHA